jgi:hypothetical protein
MRTMSEANGSRVQPEIEIEEPEENVAVLEVEVGAPDRALLEEAMQLTGVRDPSELLRVALRELVERQRFLSWVAAHDRKERSGTA